MNKKIVTLILVILISFCFLSIVVADNTSHDDNNTTVHEKTIDKDDDNVKEDITDKKKTTDKNKMDDKTNKNYILATGNENDIRLAMGLEDLFLIIQNPLQVQEMNSNVSLHQRSAIQIR